MAGARPFTTREIELFRLGTRPQQRVRALGELLLSSGARISEALDLDIEDILDLRGEIRDIVKAPVAKGDGRHGFFCLGEECRSSIQSYLKAQKRGQEGPLFMSECVIPGGRGGGRLSYRQALRDFEVLFVDLGFSPTGLTTHSFRKTFVSLRRAAGWSTLDIRDAGRWRDVSSVDRYAGAADVNTLRDRNEALLARLRSAPDPISEPVLERRNARLSGQDPTQDTSAGDGAAPGAPPG